MVNSFQKNTDVTLCFLMWRCEGVLLSWASATLQLDLREEFERASGPRSRDATCRFQRTSAVNPVVKERFADAEVSVRKFGETCGKRHLRGHDLVRRMDRQGQVLIWCRKFSGYARQRMGPKLLNCCRPAKC